MLQGLEKGEQSTGSYQRSQGPVAMPGSLLLATSTGRPLLLQRLLILSSSW